MILSDQRDKLSEILCLPIKKGVKKVEKIKITDEYIYVNDCCDYDMLKITIKFYQIIYKEILAGLNVINNGKIVNESFFGDTMCSFNNVANLISEAGKSKKKRTKEDEWPRYLKDYKKQYHCLANFWIIPSFIGRTNPKTPRKYRFYSKSKNGINDYMDKFLINLKKTYNCYETAFNDYFSMFSSYNDFLDSHFLINSFVDNNLNVFEYSNSKDAKFIIYEMTNKIKKRAESIANSVYADELWRFLSQYIA